MTQQLDVVSYQGGTGNPSPFDRIRQWEQGREYWSARDLQALMGYVEWRKFVDAIERARIACRNSGYDSESNFVLAAKVMKKGRYGSYTIEDYHLTRYACYLAAMNSDPRKEAVSQAQTYFAIKTRQAEMANIMNPASASLVLSVLTEISGKLDIIINHLGHEGQAPTHPLLQSSDHKQEVVQQFLAECCVESPGVQVRSCQFYDAYVSWAQNHAVTPVSWTIFGIAMKRRFRWKRASQGIVYVGIHLDDLEVKV